MSRRLCAIPSLPRPGRRRFLADAGAAGLALTAGPALAQTAMPSLEGYALRPSVRAGQSLGFAVRNPAAGTGTTTASFRIVRMAGWVDLTMQQGMVALRNHAVPPDAATAGCRWPAALTLPIPVGWPSGLYYAYFNVSPDSWCCVPFVVRPAAGALPQRITVVVPVSTAQAKNLYGGKSLYDYGSAGGQRASQVSFARPFAERWNYAFDRWQPLLARWLDRRGLRVDFCTDLDVHDEPALLDGTALMMVTGHHAYWTREGRTAFDGHVSRGMNAALLAGQNMRWQSRLTTTAADGSRALVCYKNAAADPEPRAAYKTTRWADLNPPEPENASVGGGSTSSLTWLRGDLPPSLNPPPVVQSQHWVFEGTGLRPTLRLPEDICGPFTDRAFSFYVNSAPGLTLLASAYISDWRANGAEIGPGNDGLSQADMVIFSRGGAAGAVFNTGMSDWVTGLQPELEGLPPNAAGIVTANVVRRLTSGTHRESAPVYERAGLSEGQLAGKYVYATTETAPYLMTYYSSATPVAFRAYIAPLADTAPVYRFRARDQLTDTYRYLLSLEKSHGYGWEPDGIAFHAFAAPGQDRAPVYRWHQVRSNDGGWQVRYASPNPALLLGTFDGLAFYAPTI